MINVSNLIGGVVSVGPAVSQPVEALSWDITLGTAGTGFGQFILGKTSSSSEMVPEAVDHVGVVVYGYLYEFGDLGILKTPAPLRSNPESKYPVFLLRSREKIGETEKTQLEFEDWVKCMNETEFIGANYNVVTKSCLVWGIRACEFLGVRYPENWDKICRWAAENSTVAGLIGGSGIQSRKVQIKAQAAEAPRKIANYFKKKLKRKKRRTTDITAVVEAESSRTTMTFFESSKSMDDHKGTGHRKSKNEASDDEEGSSSSSSSSSSDVTLEPEVGCEEEAGTVVVKEYNIDKLTVSVTKL